MKKEEWVTAREAAAIISGNNGRTIVQQYVRELVKAGKITCRPLDGRTNEYLRSDVEKIRVRIKKVADRPKPADQEEPSLVA